MSRLSASPSFEMASTWLPFGRALCAMSCSVIACAYAVVTAGGVRCDEVNRYTMESLKVKGLYFAGEVLDLDANTGGYNLQIAFSTGRLAGQLKQ